MIRRTTRIASAAAVAAFSVATASGLRADAKDPLWAKAVAIAGANDGWKPTRTVSRTEQLAKDGSVEHVDEVTLRFPAGEGEPVPQLVRHVRDGVDVTERERAKLAEERKKQSARGRKGRGSITVGIAGTPFDPRRQSAVSYQRSGETRTIDGRACRAFEYRRTDPNGGRAIGTAFLDEETGAPVWLRERPEPLPRFADSLWVALSFAYGGPGEWYATRVEVEGTGGFLFIKKHIRTTIELLDFVRPDAAGSEAR